VNLARVGVIAGTKRCRQEILAYFGMGAKVPW